MKPYIVPGILTLIVIILILAWPSPPKTDNRTVEIARDSITMLKGRLAESRKLEKTLIKNFDIRTAQDSGALERLRIEIRTIRKSRTVLKPQIQATLDSFPRVQEYIVGLEQENRVLSITVDTLEAAVNFHRQVFRDLVQNTATERIIAGKVETQMKALIAYQEAEMKNLTKQNKKERRKVKGAIAGGIALIVGALLIQ